MEQFYTLQGEGFYAGTAAWFLRLAGCDVGCVWCDVKESWDASAHPSHSAAVLTAAAAASGTRIVVITGGEPTLYDLTELCELLHAAGLKVHMETSGAHPVQGSVDWITLSPKKFKPPVDAVFGLAQELKVVIFHPSDLEWAEEHAARVQEGCKLYLQPEWSKREKINPLVISYIKENPKWQLSLQTHKYINIP
jgi:organic radical activating enzyme